MNITLGNYVYGTSNIAINSSTVYILLLTLLVNLFFFKLSNIFKKKRYPDGPWGVPVLGHLPFFGRSPPQTFRKWQEQFGNVFRIRMGSWKTVVVNGYDAIKEAADKPNDDFSSRPAFTTQRIISKRNDGVQSMAFGPFNQTYLFKRKVTSAALRKFTNRSGNVTEQMIVEEANEMVNSILAKDFSEPQSIISDIQFAVAKTIYQFLYGPAIHIDKQNELKRIVTSAERFIKFTGSGNPVDVMPWLRYVMPWKISGFLKIISSTADIRYQQIKDHIEMFSPDNIRDVVDAFLAVDLDENASEERLSRKALLMVLGDLQGAGFDTTNKTIQWLTLYMANYPDVQQRVQAEIDDVIGNGKHVTIKDRPNLVFTEATIFEVMRITAMVPFGLPRYTTRDTKVDGYDIDKDMVVFFNLHSVAFDKDYWGDPHNFRPSRFLTTDEKFLDVTKCNRILPFGVGRRRCVGEFLAKMEIFLLFSTLMHRCSIVKPKGDDLDLEPVPGLVYSPRDFKVKVIERQ